MVLFYMLLPCVLRVQACLIASDILQLVSAARFLLAHTQARY